MTQGHLATLTEWVPKAAAKIKLLDPEGKDIEDPIGGSLEVYRACRDKIAQGVDAVLARIKTTK